MTKQKWIILFVALGLIGGTAGVLVRLKSHQRLGLPGVKTTAIPGSVRLNIHLPELVLEYKSKPVDADQGVLAGLPQDSSFGQRDYWAPDGFRTSLNVVLMGTDRSTIHKPQFCLTGQGWNIDDSTSVTTTIPMTRPEAYDLPVKKLMTKKEFNVRGRQFIRHGVFVYWFVADNQLTASHGERMWSMASQLLRTGVLQRWAYVFCFSECEPGQEVATYERMQKFIQASVPQFQLVPRERTAENPVTQTALK